MPESKITTHQPNANISCRQELSDSGSGREGHRAGEVRRRLSRRRHAVLQAAAEPGAACASKAH